MGRMSLFFLGHSAGAATGREFRGVEVQGFGFRVLGVEFRGLGSKSGSGLCPLHLQTHIDMCITIACSDCDCVFAPRYSVHIPVRVSVDVVAMQRHTFHPPSPHIHTHTHTHRDTHSCNPTSGLI